MSRKRLGGVAVLAATALLVGACGSSGTGSASAAGADTSASSPSSQQAEAETGSGSAASSNAQESASTDAGSGSSLPADSSSSAGGSNANPSCDAVEIGMYTRCTNFYDDFWPVINKHLEQLYKKAKATDNGTLVIWDWYQQNQDVIDQFHKRFPDITIKSRGLTYNLSSAIVSAKATGERNTDLVSGSIVSMKSMYDQGFWKKVDWTKYGVPKAFVSWSGAPELMPDSMNGAMIHYNSNVIDSAPKSLFELDDPKYKGKAVLASFNANVFAGIGLAKGKEKMVGLIKSLKKDGVLKIVQDSGTPLSSGAIPIELNQAQFNPNPAIKTVPFKNNTVFAQFSDVNTDAKNPAAAKLWILWNAFDPTWLKQRMTNPTFGATQTPYIGLPKSVFSQSKGIAKSNADGIIDSLKNGSPHGQTMGDRDKWVAIIDAADTAVNGK